MGRWAADNVESATSLQKTVLINPKIRQLMSCRGKAGGWADARGEWVVALEKVRVKARVKARVEVAIADQTLVRPVSPQ